LPTLRRDLTQGPIGRTLLLFSLPILGGNVLQSLNGSVNAMWVGRFLGEDALTAVANANNILFFLLGSVFGLGMAATILVGQAMGRHDLPGARRVIGTSATFFLSLALGVALIGLPLSRHVLTWMGTPATALPFADASFDVVVTSDVMEHVRLDDLAHREIRRVLKPGGFYVFTVPHFRDRETLVRVRIVDPDDPAKDVDVLPREYHGDANSEDGRALAYRGFGTDLDDTLRSLGFDVAYTKEDFPELGILNTELFLCRAVREPG